MRLFAALIPPDDVLDEVERAVAPMRRATTVRWTPREMWHVTLAFYGDVDSEELIQLERGISSVAERGAVGELTLRNGTELQGRILAVDVTGDLEGLRALARRVTNAGRSAGLDLEHRRYRPHLTVARSSRPTDLRALVTALLGFTSSAWQPSEVVLVESILGEQPRYEQRARWPLGR